MHNNSYVKQHHLLQNGPAGAPGLNAHTASPSLINLGNNSWEEWRRCLKIRSSPHNFWRWEYIISIIISEMARTHSTRWHKSIRKQQFFTLTSVADGKWKITQLYSIRDISSPRLVNASMHSMHSFIHSLKCVAPNSVAAKSKKKEYSKWSIWNGYLGEAGDIPKGRYPEGSIFRKGAREKWLLGWVIFAPFSEYRPFGVSIFYKSRAPF